MNRPPADSDDESELEHSLEQGLQRPALPDEALERIRANVYAEFRRTAGAAQRRRYRWIGALAAAVSVVVVGAVLLSTYWMREAVVAELISTSGGGVLTAEDSKQTRVAAGAVLHPFGRWTARGLSLVRLPAGGTLRLAEGAVVQGGVDSHSLVLASGKAYFDFPPGSERFVLHTTIGTIEHVGTQFEVVQSEGGVRVRVREGNVLWRGDRRVISITTGNEVRVDREGRMERDTYPAYGGDWVWVEAVVPPYELENRTLIEFLTWVARETGRHVTFVDPRARAIADRTILHGGSVQGLRPMEALDQVLSTTSLHFEVIDGEIRIASRI